MKNTKTPRAGPPPDRPSRLAALIAEGFQRLDSDRRQEVMLLIEQDLDDLRRDVARQMQADVDAGRFTKREIARLVGLHEAHVNRMIAEPEKMSERFVGLASLAVPGYQDIYREFRRRADQLFLPQGSTPEANAARLLEINRELRARIPSLLDAVAELQAIAGGKAGGPQKGE